MSASPISRPVVHLALELSVTSWVVAYRLPWSDKVRLQKVSAGDSVALLALVSDLREKVAARVGPDVTLASCFEAGRDGFWLHRLLTDNGVVNHVVEPTSILVTRGARRAKTDRLDAQGLLRVLAAAFAGDREICRMVRTPSVAEEDDKRPHREREYLVQERVRIENRIAALLATEAVRKLSEFLQTTAQSKIFRNFFVSERSEGSKKRTKRIRFKTRWSFPTALYGDIRVKLCCI